jgi:hypothetical protein
MTNWLKLNVVPGSQVSTGCVKGTVQSVTDAHVLLKTLGWGGQNGTCVWVARTAIKGMYK